MKRFPNSWMARAVVAAVLVAWTGVPAVAQDSPTVSAQPAERKLIPLPPSNGQGIPLSLSQAVAIGVQNNQDQWVTVNQAESFEYLIVQNKGIYDPLLSLNASRSHSELPAASTLQAGVFDDTNLSTNVAQLTPLGGVFQLGLAAQREKTNNPFTDVNPAYTGGITLSMNQPLLRNFGTLPTNWLIYISKNQRDGAYQTLRGPCRRTPTRSSRRTGTSCTRSRTSR